MHVTRDPEIQSCRKKLHVFEKEQEIMEIIKDMKLQ